MRKEFSRGLLATDIVRGPGSGKAHFFIWGGKISEINVNRLKNISPFTQGLECGQDGSQTGVRSEEDGAPSRISGFVKMMDTLKTSSSTGAKQSGCLTVAEATELVEHYNRLYQLEIPTSRVNVSGSVKISKNKMVSKYAGCNHI